MRSKFIFLALSASLFLCLSACGIPNYFSYSSTDFEITNISGSGKSFDITVSPSIINRVTDGELSPIPQTPKLYLMYSISGTSPTVSLESYMNSNFRGYIKSMSKTTLGSSTQYTPTGSTTSLTYKLFPFREIQSGSASSDTYTGLIDFSQFTDGESITFSFSLVNDPSTANGKLIRLTAGDGTTVDLVRFNKDSFTGNIMDYNNASDSEFSTDQDASQMISPTVTSMLLQPLASGHTQIFHISRQKKLLHSH